MRVCEAGYTVAKRCVVVCDVHVSGAFMMKYLYYLILIVLYVLCKFLGIHIASYILLKAIYYLGIRVFFRIFIIFVDLLTIVITWQEILPH